MKKKKLYSEPILKEIGIKEEFKIKDHKPIVVIQPVHMVHLDMKHSLKLFLEMKGLFEAIKIYKSNLEKETEKETKILQHFVQGELWKEQLHKFKNEKGDLKDSIVLPLKIAFDGVETGNALGSHAGQNEVGAVYCSIACLPPQIASKLNSILLTDLFFSADKKEFGNKKIFQALVEDLTSLRNDGLEINVNNKIEKVYFITSIIMGDNLGLNSILGFSESFSKTRFCRICTVSSEDSHTLLEEDPKLLRTVEQYAIQAIELKTSETGIKEYCFFNDLDDYHLIKNAYCDVMHDVNEGVAGYTMADIIEGLIAENILNINTLNAYIQAFDYGYDSANKPPKIDMDYIRKNSKLKMSASETLNFTRYFGCIIGHLVPEGNKFMELYYHLRQIIHILYGLVMTESDILMLIHHIYHHHKLYKELFGNLKPKFHILLHYAKLIRRLGPLVFLSMMRFESKHRDMKKIVSNTSSKLNLLITIAKRISLGLMHLSEEIFIQEEIALGKIKYNDNSAIIDFPTATEAFVLKSVTVNGIKYTADNILLFDIDKDGLCFGKIINIYSIDKEIHIKYQRFEVTGFNEHYFAYEVFELNEFEVIHQKNILLRTPCVSILRNFPDNPEVQKLYIALKHTV